ncbi:hypothetical protein DITRI_Ditri17bG0120800 [Diplodiscus trichospermus]
MAQIQHFLHRHPLVLVEENEEEINDEVKCSGCLDRLSDPFYRCIVCTFYLHKSCAELPGEIQNSFHPCPLVLEDVRFACNACSGYGNGFSYHCKRCNFDMHVQCTQRPTMKSEGEEVIHHYTHWHPLTIVDQKKDLEVRCRICEKQCSDSSDSSAYGCRKCNFFLHNSCMINIPQQINHFFHPSCPLILLTTKYDKCISCDEYGSGLVFRCGKCDFQLDVKCSLLPTIESKGADKIQHYAHQHSLALREIKEFDNEVWCIACGENCTGPCFVCERCEFFLHRQCTLEFPLEIHHPSHPSHPLSLTLFPPSWDLDYDTFQCRAFEGYRYTLTYRCATCDFNLHTDCAKPKLEHILLKYDGHGLPFHHDLHFLKFRDKTRDKIYCDICDWPVCNCFLRCLQCEFNIHLYCFPSIAKTIKHQCHLHPLTLTESPFEFELNISEDKYNSDDEFYCDVCEEKRFKRESIYYCEECRFIAEIRCVKSELLPSLFTSEGQSSVDGRTIPQDEENSILEATMAEVNNEIAALSAKEKPLEAEIKRLEEELKPIKQRLERLKKIQLRCNDQLNLNRN